MRSSGLRTRPSSAELVAVHPGAEAVERPSGRDIREGAAYCVTASHRPMCEPANP
ncbi:hypothetical protein GCM10027072_15170 [Streptomyces bullii]